MRNISIINGPNINLLGLREKSIYGNETYETLKQKLNKFAGLNNLSLDFFQSNSEGKIIDKIQEIALKQNITGLVINPAAYTHTSIGIRDSLTILQIPIIEVHISDINKREDFRKHSYISDIVTESIIGKGLQGYEIALQTLLNLN